MVLFQSRSLREACVDGVCDVNQLHRAMRYPALSRKNLVLLFLVASSLVATKGLAQVNLRACPKITYLIMIHEVLG